jgi:hypothetical protein
MSTLLAGLQFATIAAKVFSEERQRHYDKKIQDLQDAINEVEDSGYYEKDQEKKGRAQRDLYQRKQNLEIEMVNEAKSAGILK